jgi:glycerol dehydrogenase
LAAAHAINIGLISLEETHAYYHGEKVAFGVLVGLHLNNAPAGEIEKVYSFCKSVGLPTTLAGIGIKNTQPEYLMKVAVNSSLEGSTIYHEACEVSPQKVLEAILKADEWGRGSLVV